MVSHASGDGGVLLVKTVNARPEREDTYNFEVADTHTYFVGKLQAWVHNSCSATDLIGNGGKQLDSNTIVGVYGNKYVKQSDGSYAKVGAATQDEINRAGVTVQKGGASQPLSATDVYSLNSTAAANKLPNEISDISRVSFDANNPYVLNNVPLSTGSPAKGYTDLGTHTVDLTGTVTNLNNLPSKTFYNNEGILPSQYGPYTEYRVPPGSTDSNRQRIVVGRDGTMFYTPDHYNTFIPLN